MWKKVQLKTITTNVFVVIMIFMTRGSQQVEVSCSPLVVCNEYHYKLIQALDT